MIKRRTGKWTNKDDTLDEQFVFLDVDAIRSIEVQLLERKI